MLQQSIKRITNTLVIFSYSLTSKLLLMQLKLFVMTLDLLRIYHEYEVAIEKSHNLTQIMDYFSCS